VLLLRRNLRRDDSDGFNDPGFDTRAPLLGDYPSATQCTPVNEYTRASGILDSRVTKITHSGVQVLWPEGELNVKRPVFSTTGFRTNNSITTNTFPRVQLPLLVASGKKSSNKLPRLHRAAQDRDVSHMRLPQPHENAVEVHFKLTLFSSYLDLYGANRDVDGIRMLLHSGVMA
jgi:hypothetical protein